MEKLAQDQPLPQSMFRKVAGWSAMARQYPVFSRTWFNYRVRAFVVPLGLLALTLLGIAAIISAEAQSKDIYLAFGLSWILIAGAALLGRGLATLVCRQGWSPTREAIAVSAAVLCAVLLATSFSSWTRVQGKDARQNSSQDRIANYAVWLVVFCWLGGVTDLVAYFRQRRMFAEAKLVEQMERYRDERNAVEQRLSALASQVEPHFLFNTLSGVRAAMLSDPARGIVMLDHLVDYLRSTIPQLRADGAKLYVPLGAQLDAVHAYLGIIRARMPRLDFAIDCPPALRAAPIPPLMLISLVENAVKHGIELKKGPAHIQVSAKQVGQQLALSVSDNGAGFGSQATGGGIGLSNIRERLQHLYQGAAALSLQANEGGGVTARIALPMGEQ